MRGQLCSRIKVAPRTAAPYGSVLDVRLQWIVGDGLFCPRTGEVEECIRPWRKSGASLRLVTTDAFLVILVLEIYFLFSEIILLSKNHI